MLPTKLQKIKRKVKSTDLSVQEKNRKQDFQYGGNIGFPIGLILAISDLQVTPIFPTKFRVNCPRGVGGVIVDDARGTTDIDRSQ